MDHGATEQTSIYEKHRAEIIKLIPRWYSPVLHFLIPAVLGLGAMIAAIANIHQLRSIELLAIPATLVLGFAFEWRVHKWVLHHRTPGVQTLYERHELQHHVIYTYDHMQLRDYREMWTILMPSYAVVLVFIMNVPFALIAWKLFTFNTALVFLATAMIFFLTYEWLHASYHMPPTTWIGRNPIIARLRELHRRHHDPRLMKSWNFNVSLPVFDVLYGTLWNPEREALLHRKQREKAAKKRAASVAITNRA
jgi:sterol desaturase/sphingolipid hydroxylase (fatty acid hydroxylase superfamily)